LTAKPESVKRQALQMYLEGLGFSSIGCILRLSHVSVLNWIRKYGREIDKIRNDKPVEVMELDELHTYIGQKNYRWVWTCVNRDRREYVDFVVGNRGTETGLKLWKKIGNLAQVIVATDYWKSCNEIVPSQILVQTKISKVIMG